MRALPTVLTMQIVHAAAPPTVEFARDNARPVRLDLGSGEVPLQAQGGGFSMIDFKAHQNLPLQDETMDRHVDGSETYRAQSGDLTLEATFTPKTDGSVHVSGLLKCTRSRDRAIILRYLVPMKTEGAVFGYDPGGTQPVGPETQALMGTIFPVAAMAQKTACVALAIPPSFPCCFGMRGTQAGLAVEFYLGLAPETKLFPDQARFDFLIYSADAAWPFRSALARYYEMAPDYYTPRVPGGGFWNKHEPGNIDDALPLYRFEVLSPKELSDSEIQRRRSLGVLSFDYLLVGNLKMKDLPKMPESYDAAMKVYADFARGKEQSQPDSLAKLIERSACKDAEGRCILDKIAKGENTAEGDTDENAGKARRDGGDAGAQGNDLTFIVNPNPGLFADLGSESVGSQTIRHCKEMLATEPIDGFEFDSLGSRWPAHLNFRRDQFPYERYPLTFDDQGRVAIHNRISHYECIEAMRALTRAHNKFLFGNGIYTYTDRPGAKKHEQYDSQENGRFFLAALLDVLGRENSALVERSSLEQMRAMAGSKLFTMVMYKWDDPEMVRIQMNRNLVYAVFGMPSNKSKGYIESPAFARDRQLIDWSLKNGKLLQNAGWQPVTDAHIDSPDVGFERYGEGKTVYFALINFAGEPRDCSLAIDLAALDMPSQPGSALRVQEIAQNATITPVLKGGECHVQIRLRPNEAHIIQVSTAP